MSNFLISCRNDSDGKGTPGLELSKVSTYIQLPDWAPDYNLRQTMLPADWMKAIYGPSPVGKTVLVFVHGYHDPSSTVVDRHKSIKDNIPSDVSLVSFDWP